MMRTVKVASLACAETAGWSKENSVTMETQRTAMDAARTARSKGVGIAITLATLARATRFAETASIWVTMHAMMETRLTVTAATVIARSRTVGCARADRKTLQTHAMTSVATAKLCSDLMTSTAMTATTKAAMDVLPTVKLNLTTSALAAHQLPQTPAKKFAVTEWTLVSTAATMAT